MGDIKTRFTLEGEQRFRSAMTNAANAVKVLNAEEKLAKAQFQQTGDAEKYAAQQADILKQKIEAQKNAVKAAEQALKQLNDNGVSKSSKQFQQWQTKLLNAQTSLTKMETDLQKVTGTLDATTDSAEKTGGALEAVGKKVSYDGVINGIGRITGAMEAAFQKAKQLGTELVNFVNSAAASADEIATTATVNDLTTQEVQQMQYTADILDTTYEDIMKSRQKLAKYLSSAEASGKDSLYGIPLFEEVGTGKYGVIKQLRDIEDIYWEIGNLMTTVQEEGGFEAVNSAATEMFGRSWERLRPIFASDWASEDNYLGRAFGSAREYYEAVMASWDVNSDDTMNKLTKYDDAIQTLQNNLETLEMTVAGELAPGFEKVANFVSELVSEFNKYLETEEGQQKLSDLSDAIVGLFEGLTDVDFGDALELAKGAIKGLTTGLNWIKDNWQDVKSAIEDLAVAFGLLKVSETVLTFMQLLASGKYLFKDGKLSGYDAGGGETGGGGTDGSGGPVVTGGSNVETRTEKIGMAAAVQSVLRDTWELINNAANGAVADWAAAQAESGFINEGDIDEVTRRNEEMLAAAEAYLQKKQEVSESVSEGLWTDEEAKSLEDRIRETTAAFENNPIGIDSEIELPDNENEIIAEKIGTVTVPLEFRIDPNYANYAQYADKESGGHHANGLPWVPYDGYIAMLHRGERVLTAGQNRSYTYNSNNYFGNVNLNNGQDIDKLCDSIDRHNRRAQSGFGS